MVKPTEKENTMSKKNDTPEPMDASIRENTTPRARPNNERTCYAVRTLVSEVREIFPDIPVEYSNLDVFNAALDVEFDATVLDEDDTTVLHRLLGLLDADKRVEIVVTDDDRSSVLVSMSPSMRTKDLKDSFGLGEAYDILMDGSV